MLLPQVLKQCSVRAIDSILAAHLAHELSIDLDHGKEAILQLDLRAKFDVPFQACAVKLGKASAALQKVCILEDYLQVVEVLV